MKSTLAIFVFVISLSFPVAAQRPTDRGLVLTGSVQGVETKCLNGKPVMQVRLYMQFRNDGTEPILLITPSLFFTAKVNFINRKLGDPTNAAVQADVIRYNPYSDDPFGPGSSDDYDPMPSFVKSLNRPEPPFSLAPGGYREFLDTLYIKNGFRIDIKPGTTQRECELSKGKPVPEYSSFSLEYQLSLKKYDRGTELLEELQRRWKRFGYLPLNDQGDILFKSERIDFLTGKQ